MAFWENSLVSTITGDFTQYPGPAATYQLGSTVETPGYGGELLSESQTPAMTQSSGVTSHHQPLAGGSSPSSASERGPSLAPGPQCLLPALICVPLLLCQQGSCCLFSACLSLHGLSPHDVPMSHPQARPKLVQPYIPKKKLPSFPEPQT